jgi:hypothetical protein
MKHLHTNADYNFPTVNDTFLGRSIPNYTDYGSLGRKSPEQFLKIFNQKSVPYKTEKKSDIVSNFNPVLSKN